MLRGDQLNVIAQYKALSCPPKHESEYQHKTSVYLHVGLVASIEVFPTAQNMQQYVVQLLIHPWLIVHCIPENFLVLWLVLRSVQLAKLHC